MGDRFTKATGRHAKDDPLGAINFALDELLKVGDYREWYGADNAFKGQAKPSGRFKKITRIPPR